MKIVSISLLCLAISGCAIFGQPASELETDAFVRPLDIVGEGTDAVVVETGELASAEKIAPLAAPFLAQWGTLVVGVVGILAGWYTRKRKEELEISLKGTNL
jgi:hypothetical protein